jgi:hypothetical protein
MSNYIQKAYNPKTGKIEDASYIDDYFGKHQYGVAFPDGRIYKDWEVKPYYEDIPAQANNTEQNKELNKNIEEIYEVIHTGGCNDLNNIDDNYEKKSKEMLSQLISTKEREAVEGFVDHMTEHGVDGLTVYILRKDRSHRDIERYFSSQSTNGGKQ